ncbi:helix-turn-helix domain-containing protein [Lactobacillus taiwanensis]|uniref:helix-turn-helix domain-containing protein n=1 Tax=Lactobacillus taiwanensis TaxID=508451 RepID=UPI002430A5FF|nr:helix-turn-helix domain-containing protein [Lactobacillus taiwanensis]
MEAIEKANGLVSEAFELVYKDAKSKAPKLKNPMYGYFNKTKASVYLGISRTTFDVWLKKYQIPYTMIDGIRRYAKKDLDKFMEEHKR